MISQFSPSLPGQVTHNDEQQPLNLTRLQRTPQWTHAVSLLRRSRESQCSECAGNM